MAGHHCDEDRAIRVRLQMTDSNTFVVREALDQDVEQIRDVFVASYGEDYAYPQFYDIGVLKKMVYCDETLLLVAEEISSGRVVGTASVVLETGARADLLGEFGRLAVHPDYRHRGIGKLLLIRRLELIGERLHVGIVEPRLTHVFTQKSVISQGFAPVGMLPMSLRLDRRESVGLCVRYFGDALCMRRNHPRVIPEAHQLSRLAMEACGIEFDAIVDDASPAYPHQNGFDCEELTSDGYLPLLHIERGRVRHREVFGPTHLHYGLFKLRADKAHYLIAKHEGRIVGAVGLILNDIDNSARIFELIAVENDPIRFLLEETCRKCQHDWKIEHLTVDVSAYSPQMQRTLLELRFLPVAYVPAMVFHEVERLDTIRMVKLMVTPQFNNVELVPELSSVASLVMKKFAASYLVPEISRAVQQASLFRELTSEQVARLAAACSLQTLSIGETIFREGQKDDHLYLILCGRADVTSGRSLIATAESGDTLGEMSMLASAPHFATADVRETVEAAVLKQCDLEELVRARPDIGTTLYRNLAAGLANKLRMADKLYEV